MFTAAHLSGDSAIASDAVHLANDLIKLTETLYHQRRYQEAIEAGYIALDERPNSSTARRYLIRGLIQEEKWTEAVLQIERSQQYAPKREILYHWGFLERHRGDIPKAIHNYKKAKELGWTGFAINRELAYCYYRLEEYDKAAEHIKEASQYKVTNRFIVDLSAQIAIRRGDKETAQQALETLAIIDNPIYYFHRLSTFERVFGTNEAALEAAQKAVNEDLWSTPFGVLAQLADCQIESGQLEEARKSIKILNKRYPRIKNDVRQGLLCKLENHCGNYSDALRITKLITDKDGFIYKKLKLDALRGELSTSALSDNTRSEYKSEFVQLEEELQHIRIDEIVRALFDIEIE
jgi:tetratricopeptide (TPR) repeat protein